ncbi:MAG: SGNH/GDSL hydrolase family protein [Clostridia bacterium]|nr:SGNH/GDSL hydrolase family protein [Clostridia bacterium]
MKKLTAYLLVLAMLLSLLPVTGVLAATDETNFDPVKLTITGAGSTGTGKKRLVADASVLPFTVTRAGQLAGCLLNGTITYSGSKGYSASIPFVDVPLASSPVRNDTSKINLDFAVPEGYTIEMDNPEHLAGKYTYDLTLSPAPAQEEYNVYNFEPFKIRFVTRGASGLGKRIVIQNDFPFAITEANTLQGCLLNGTVTYTGPDDYSPSVPFVDVVVGAQPLRTDGNISLDFAVPEGYTIKGENDQAEYYTWDLTISPKPLPQTDIPEEGNTFFVLPKHFRNNLGTWEETTDGSYSVLYAGTSANKTDAFTGIKIPATATYNIYSLVKDFSTQAPGTRYAKISVNGTTLTDAGKHGTDGYKWEKIGQMSLEKDAVAEIRMLGTSASYARMAALMFTTEDDYIPADDKLFADLEFGAAETARLGLSTSGTHLYIPYSAFTSDLGDWTVENNAYLFGSNDNTLNKPATALIEIPADGTYYVWGYAKDFTSNNQGSRHAKIGINGKELANKIGQHGATEDTGSSGSFGWTLAGKVKLKQGKVTVSLHNTSFNFARVKAVLMTTDEAFSGFQQETTGNALDFTVSPIDDIIDVSCLSSYGNKIDFTLRNRTANALAANTKVITTLYTADGVLADVNVKTLTNGLGAYKSSEVFNLIMSPTSEWATGKVMIWDSLEKFNPLETETTFTFTPEDYANPDEDAGADFGTVTSYMLDYVPVKDVYKDEYYNRDGLNNTLLKLQKGEDVTIAYLGGSITQQNTWRTYTTKWFEENYEGNITEVNIGIAGTGANLAVCRIDQDILVHNPDLVFIEYAVNGGEAKDMEGMVRKVWEHDPTTDICFVYTTITSNYSTYAAGDIHNYAKVFEGVAEYYGVPSVFFGKQAFDLYDQGKLTLSAKTQEEGKILYTTDGVHPTTDGGWLAAGAIARSVVNMEKTFDKETYTETNHTMPETYYDAFPWVDASYSMDWDKMKFEGTWMDCSLDESNNFKNFPYSGGYLSEFKKMFPKLTGTKVAESSVTVKFKGTDIGVFEAGGQFSGQLRVIVDGTELSSKLKLYNNNDSKLRHQYYFIDTLPYGEHTVTFILDSTMPDKSYLQGQHPNDTLYERNEFYLGRILVNGEILDINE